MINNKVLLVLSFLALACCTTLHQKVLRPSTLSFNNLHKNVHIRGGTNAKKGEIPYQCAILAYHYNPFGPICGCTILSPYTVVTAAHCAEKLRIDPLENAVRYGTLKVETGSPNVYLETDLVIDKIIIHPKYNTTTAENDIALIIVKERMNLNRIKAAKAFLPYEGFDPIDGTNVTASGWGIENSEEYIQPTKLKKLSVQIFNRAECKFRYGSATDNINLVTNSMICAEGLDKSVEGVCEGDSGGPLVIGYGRQATLVGIVSKGVCGRPGDLEYPGIYTLVSKFLKFIEDNKV